MRAWDIAFFLILIQASIGFVNGVGIFDADTVELIETPQNKYSEYNLTTLNETVGDPNKMGIVEWAYMAVTWVFQAFIIILQMLLSVVIVFPLLVDVFHIPTVLAVFLQAGVYIIYAAAVIQFKSNRSFRNFE